MKRQYVSVISGFILVLLAGCSQQDDLTEVSIGENTIVINGSSTVFPISTEAAKRFIRQQPDTEISVKFSGTNAGFKLFCNGETDVSNASRPINAQEIAQCDKNQIDYVELPLAQDALAVVVHPSNDWVASLTLSELKTIWSKQSEDKIMNWNQVRSEWPDKLLSLYGRGRDSGTYDYFTTHVTGVTRESRSDYVASEDEEFLAEHIASDKNALGFFGIGAYHRHWDTLKLVPIDNGNGPVYPSMETVANGQYSPFSRPLFLYVNKQSLEDKPKLKIFLTHYYSNIATWLHFTGYMPLSEAQYADNIQKLLN